MCINHIRCIFGYSLHKLNIKADITYFLLRTFSRMCVNHFMTNDV